MMCGLVGLLVIYESFCIIFRDNTGLGTNNKAEVLYLIDLMNIYLELNIKEFYVFGDSELWVDFMNKDKQILNINLQGIGNKLKELVTTFNSFWICHIFIEGNEVADSFSNQGLQLEDDIVKVFTTRNGNTWKMW